MIELVGLAKHSGGAEMLVMFSARRGRIGQTVCRSRRDWLKSLVGYDHWINLKWDQVKTKCLQECGVKLSVELLKSICRCKGIGQTFCESEWD